MTAVGLDHVVLAAPDLDATVARFAELTGVEPAGGGSHVGLGTANYLVGLGAGAYLEIVGPDPSQPSPSQPRPFGIDGLTEARLCTWAVRSIGIQAQIAAARSRGYDPGPAAAMSRVTPDGELLSWQLTAPRLDMFGGLVPFVIDWGTTPHPSSRELPSTPLVALTATDPEPEAVARALIALGAELTVTRGDASALLLSLATATGTVTLA